MKKRWIDKDASEQDEAPTAPPPKDHELPGGPAGMFPLNGYLWVVRVVLISETKKTTVP